MVGARRRIARRCTAPSARRPGSTARTQRAERAPGAVAGQVEVRFDANMHPGLPWRFEPEQTTVKSRRARRPRSSIARKTSARERSRRRRCTMSRPTRSANISRRSSASASPSRRFKPGQTVDMPVVFFVDPAIEKDPDTKDIHEITLELHILPGGNRDCGPLEPRTKPDEGSCNTWPRQRTTIIISSNPIRGR